MAKTSFNQKIILLTCSIAISLFIAELLLNISGYVYLGLIERRNRISLGKKASYRIIFFGESTTAEGGWNSYPREVGKILNQRLPDRHISIINKGMPAVNTSFILSQLEENLNKYKPHMVVAMMGINDAAEDTEEVGTNKIKEFIKRLDLCKLIKTLRLRFREKEILREKLLERGNFAQEMKNYPKAKRMFKRAIELEPNKEDAYIGLGLCYEEEGKYQKVQEMLEKALALNPANLDVYIPLGSCYEKQGKLTEAEKIFKRYVTLSTDASEGYISLGWLYYAQGKYLEAEEMFKRVIIIYPDIENGFLELARYYRQRKNNSEAKQTFSRAIRAAPYNEYIYMEMGWFYDELGESSKAKILFEKAIAINPRSDEPYIELERFYKKYKMDNQAAELRKKIESNVWDKFWYHDITVHNYQKLKEICRGRKIKLVCVQYPRRSVEPLKAILAPAKGIIFVDNQKIFTQAIEKGKFEDYFVDRLAGDFGHCTPEGNRLLAGNVAEAIMQVLNQK